MIITADDLSVYVYEMNRVRSDQYEKLDKIPDDLINEAKNFEDIEDENLPRIQKVREILGNDYYSLTITGFSIADLTILIEQSEGYFCTGGHGRKYDISSTDLIVIFLHYLRRYPRFEEGAFLFGINKCTYERYIESAMKSAIDCWYNKYVILPGEHVEPPICDDFDVSYIVDATVQIINVPIGSFEEKKKFFSGTHSIYCLKS